MSPGIATLVAGLMYALAVAPFVWLAVRPGSAPWLAPIAGAFVLAIAFLHTGVLQRRSLASTDVMRLIQLDFGDDRCQRIFDVMTDNGILLERPAEGRMVVRGAAWDQVPATIRDAVMACIDTSTDDAEAAEPAVIRR